MSKNIACIMGSFHKDEITKMLEAARIVSSERGCTIVKEIWVPGSVEKPLAIKKMLQRSDVDGVVALGIIERGETKHGMTMGQGLMDMVMQLSVDFEKPIGLGVLGPEIELDQIETRILPYAKKAVHAVADMFEQDYTN